MNEKPLTMVDLLIMGRQLSPKIIESPWVPEDSIFILNDLNLPDRRPVDWDTMTTKAKIEWAVNHGMAIAVRRG